MQIVETTNEGLKRGYTVTIPASLIAAKVEGEIARVAPQVQLPGFRAGKVPANLVRKRFGAQIHQDALEGSIREALDKVVVDQALRPATQPEVALGEGYAEGQDATLTVALEVLPTISAPDLSGLKLEKLVVPIADEALDEAVQRVASSAKRFEDAEEGKEAAEGDQLIIDFLGKLDGVPFDGGKAEDAALEIGSGRFIPGFEEQLVGAKVGDEKIITVTFPEDYQAENLAGKETTFDITVKSIKVAAETVIDDEFAKSLGLTDLDQLKTLLKGQLEGETAQLTRTQMKRQLLDILAEGHDFDVPPSMVEAEFNQIWQQLTQEAGREEDPEAALAEIEAEKDDYRAIAVRRVRLGLLLSEIGQSNGVEVTNQEMQMLVQQAAQQYRPEDRQRFAEYIQNEPLAAAQLRAPLYEEKVVDFLFDKAEVTEREVTKDELEAAIEADEGEIGGHVHGPDCDHDHDHAPKKKAKKAVSEDAPADAGAAEAEEAPKKKAAAKKKAAEGEDAPAAEDAPKKKPAAKKKAAED